MGNCVKSINHKKDNKLDKSLSFKRSIKCETKLGSDKLK